MFDYRRKPKVDVDLHHLAHSQTQAAWFSALAALLSIPLSMVALYQSHQARVESHWEKIKVTVQRHSDDHPTTRPTKGKTFYIPGTIETTWDLNIANNGDVPISVTDYEAQTMVHDGSMKFYTGCGCNLNYKTKSQLLPLNIAAGLSKRISIHVGVVGDQNSLYHLIRLIIRSPSPDIDLSNYYQEITFRVKTARDGEFYCQVPWESNASDQTANRLKISAVQPAPPTPRSPPVVSYGDLFDAALTLR